MPDILEKNSQFLAEPLLQDELRATPYPLAPCVLLSVGTRLEH